MTGSPNNSNRTWPPDVGRLWVGLQRLRKPRSPGAVAQQAKDSSPICRPRPDAAGAFSLKAAVLLFAGVVVFAVAAFYAYCKCFSWFSPYDDEGFIMTSVRGFLEGHALYNEIFTCYGPVYYYYQWLIHGLIRLPL